MRDDDIIVATVGAAGAYTSSPAVHSAVLATSAGTEKPASSRQYPPPISAAPSASVSRMSILLARNDTGNWKMTTAIVLPVNR